MRTFAFRYKQNANKGMTLVELIIVITILAIMSSGTVSILGILNGRTAQKHASALTSLLSKTKVVTMSSSYGGFDQPYEKRYQDGNGDWVTEPGADIYLEFVSDGTKITSAQLVNKNKKSGDDEDASDTIFDTMDLTGTDVEVEVIFAKGINNITSSGRRTVTTTSTGGNPVRVAFSRKSGELLPEEIPENEKGKKSEYLYAKLIKISQGRKTYYIHISPATGEIWMNTEAEGETT